eukprot:351937-Chlamydomonas_euryale.AAC.4
MLKAVCARRKHVAPDTAKMDRPSLHRISRGVPQRTRHFPYRDPWRQNLLTMSIYKGCSDHKQV